MAEIVKKSLHSKGRMHPERCRSTILLGLRSGEEKSEKFQKKTFNINSTCLLLKKPQLRKTVKGKVKVVPVLNKAWRH
jgi:hypothetical protein